MIQVMWSLLQELLALQQKTLAQQNEMDHVRSDNVKLYEKIKFLQNYPTAKGSGPSSLDDMESRYSAQYEQKLDPFTHFNKKVYGITLSIYQLIARHWWYW